jgi:DtxR family Mn-dependent transcriptional regulator
MTAQATTTQTPAIEEYLQTIYTLADEGGEVIGARIAEFLSVSPASVSEMLHRLERERLITLEDRHEVRLTASGQAAANSIVRRHRLAERFLVDVLGYEWWRTHEEAERLEHVMTEEMQARITKLLGDPQSCPHGNPMPGVKADRTRPLGELRRGEASRVERIPDQFEHEPGFLEYLDSVGIRPGRDVTLLDATAGGLRIRVGDDEREVRPDLARKVWVSAA